MAPLPKRRHSTRRGGKRKAAITLPLLGLYLCPNCSMPTVPHRPCGTCGFYKGKSVVVKKEKKSKKK